MGLIKCGLDADFRPGFGFRHRTGAAVGEIRERGAFQLEFELNGARGFASRILEFIEAIRCSRAFREALVSRANRGVEWVALDVEGGLEDGGGDSWDSSGGIVRLWLSLVRMDRGAPRPVGFLTNLLSVEADVGRSSNDSNSVPSPKLRRLVGRVSVRLEVDPVFPVFVSPRLRRKGSGRADRDSREIVPGGLRRSPEFPELVRREDR